MAFGNKTPNVNPPGITKFLVIGGLLLFLFLILTQTTFITIDPGQKGVIFKRFSGGLEKDNIYAQGFTVVAPWNKMYVYDVRIQEEFEQMDVLSKNGLNIEIELTYRFAPIQDKIGYLHDQVGPDYTDKIIKPEIRSATREVIGQYLPEELYSTKREAIQVEIFEQTKKAIEPKYLVLDAVLIRSVQLPDNLKASIEQKLQEEQEALQYEFRLLKETKEAERKIIEAQAKADANKILNASLTTNILRDKGIEATIELAKSPNSKVIIVGDTGSGGLPLILGGN